ncbi:MAG: DUF479 domain-containing protein [Porticoccaceae bacterium]|nr:DUF479 domain-containing protein [Porticoccaceae bacterium]
MNYLAHLLLSGPNPDTQVGGLLGDFVKGPLKGGYPPEVEQGIRLHRQIDTLTAHLPAMTQLNKLFESPWRRYAGVVVDIAFDHLLAQRWQEFHRQTLPEFCADFYQHLSSHRHRLPEQAQQFCDRAPGLGWLESYADPDIMATILNRVGTRFRRPVALGDCWPIVQANHNHFDRAFDETMMELSLFAESFLHLSMSASSISCDLTNQNLDGRNPPLIPSQRNAHL